MIFLRFTSHLQLEAWKKTNFTQCFFIQVPGKYISQAKQFKQDKRGGHKKKYTYLIEQVLFLGVAKAGSGNKGYSIDGFYVQGAIV